jgi:hypothetical protein
MTRNANPSEATIASELLRKLAEKERKRKFDSIGLADPRVVEPSSSSKAIEDEEAVSKVLEKKDEDKTFKEPEEDDSNGDNEEKRIELRNYEKDKRSKRKRSVARLRDRKFSTVSIAKKKSVVVTAAAIVVGRRLLLAYLGRGFL